MFLRGAAVLGEELEAVGEHSREDPFLGRERVGGFGLQLTQQLEDAAVSVQAADSGEQEGFGIR